MKNILNTSLQQLNKYESSDSDTPFNSVNTLRMKKLRKKKLVDDGYGTANDQRSLRRFQDITDKSGSDEELKTTALKSVSEYKSAAEKSENENIDQHSPSSFNLSHSDSFLSDIDAQVEKNILEHTPFVQQSYQTVGDQQFDLAIDKLAQAVQNSTMTNEISIVEKNKIRANNLSILTEPKKDPLQPLGGAIGVDLKKYLFPEKPDPKPFRLDPEHQKTLSAFEIDEEKRKQASIFSSLKDISLPEYGIKESTNRSTVLTESQWESLIERLNRPCIKKERIIQDIKNDLERKFEIENTHHPSINEKSKKLASGLTPIQERWETIAKEKNQKIERAKKVSAKKSLDGATFTPEITECAKHLKRDAQTFLAWKADRDNKLKALRDNLAKAELAPCSFTPVLSNRSIKIMKRKKPKAVWDRNYEFEFQRNRKINAKILDEMIQDRKPKITEFAARIPRTEPVGERLYNLAKISRAKQNKEREEQFKLYYNDGYYDPIKPISSSSKKKKTIEEDEAAFGDVEDKKSEEESFTKKKKAASKYSTISESDRELLNKLRQELDETVHTTPHSENEVRETEDVNRSTYSLPSMHFSQKESPNNFDKVMDVTMNTLRQYRAAKKPIKPKSPGTDATVPRTEIPQIRSSPSTSSSQLQQNKTDNQTSPSVSSIRSKNSTENTQPT